MIGPTVGAVYPFGPSQHREIPKFFGHGLANSENEIDAVRNKREHVLVILERSTRRKKRHGDGVRPCRR